MATKITNQSNQLNIINQKGEIVDIFTISEKAWQYDPLSSWNLSLTNRYYLSNKRQATSKTKDRGEVNGSTRKIYRQKGTGGARHGSRYAPQFRGGGIAFGPTGKENYSLNINKKFKKKMFQSLLAEKMSNKEVIIVDKISMDSYKTKEATKFLNALTIGKSKTLLILSKEAEKHRETIYSFRNLPYVETSNSELVNFSQIMSSNYVVFTPTSLVEMEKRLSDKTVNNK